MTNSTGKSYFDLHISGIGYLNRIREVKPDKGRPYLSCDIAALNGPSDDVSYVRFDTNVSGSEAQHLVRRCKQAVEAKKKVLIGFRLGDLRATTFMQTKGENAGKPCAALKARLLFIGFIKVDGKEVYKAEPKPGNDEGDADAAKAAVADPQDAPASTPPAAAAEAFEEAPADAPAPAMAESF